MQKPTVVCELCGHQITINNYKKHLRRHEQHPETFRDPVVQHEGLDCQYCGKTCRSKNSLIQHEIRCPQNINHIVVGHHGPKKPWNKGLSADNNDLVKHIAESCHQYYQTHRHPWTGRKHKKSTINLMKKHCGGIRPRSGRGKKGKYKGYYCDSTYELVYIIYCLDHGLKFMRNTSRYYEYTVNGIVHKYYPDFYTDNGWVEIKGYMTPLVELKTQAVKDAGDNIKVLLKTDSQLMFKYVREHYQYKKITDLYD